MQQFRFIDGKIQNTFSGKCLDIDAGSYPADGSKVSLWDCHSGDNQKWTLLPSGEIKNLPSGKCLDINGQNYPNQGAMLTLWNCNGRTRGGDNQKWRLESSVDSALASETEVGGAPISIFV